MAHSARMMSALLRGLLMTCFLTPLSAGQSLDDYRSVTPVSASWKNAASWQRYNGSTWVAAATYPTDANTHAITVRSGSTLSVTSALTVDDLTVESGATVTNSSTLTLGATLCTMSGTLSNTGTLVHDGMLIVYGTLRNSGTVTASDNSIWVRTGGTYQHDVATTAGAIPGCTWETGSTLLISGYTSNTEELSLLGNQELQDLTWNCPGQTGAIPFPSDFSTILGTFRITSTGSGSIITNTTGSNHLYTIDGDLIHTGGTLNLSSGSEGTDLLVKGNVSLTGGTMTMTGSATRSPVALVPNDGSTPVNLTVASAYTMASGPVLLIFTGTEATLTEDCYLDAGALELAGTLHCGTYIIRGARFEMTTTWSTLGIGDEHGIAASAAEGNIQTTSRILPENISFLYEYASGDSYTGDGLPSNVYSFTSSNTGGALHFEKSVTVEHSLTVNSPIHLDTYDLTLRTDASVTASAQVAADNSGSFTRLIGSSGSYLFPVGSENDYSPFTLSITASGFSSAAVEVNVHTDPHPSNTSPSSYLTRYWSLSGSGFSGLSYDGSFTYLSGDIEGTEANIYCGRYSGTDWFLGDQTTTATNTMTIQDQTAFGAITGGEPGSLPVQVADVRAWRSGDVTHVGWRTLSEVNNYGFHVQRKEGSDGVFADLAGGFLPGYGTTIEAQSYEFIDHDPSPGVCSYRLRQVDLNGSEHMMGEVRLDAATSVDEPAQPRAFALLQNYPNPFNPSTTMVYDLPVSGMVLLEVCDALGRTVAVPVHEMQTPGRHIVTFDGSRLASGVYLYRLHADGKVAVRAMLLVR